MKNNMKYFLLLLVLPVVLSAQYTGGNGRGDALTSITASALPVELTSFTASISTSAVSLSWITATEVNNYGFEIERRATANQPVNQSSINNWNKIGFVAGNGTSNAPHSYSFSDNSASAGRYVYRLKQIDKDGTFKYSSEAEVNVDVPTETVLRQNFPNPFNPETVIGYWLVVK